MTHLQSPISHLPSVICYLLSIICYLLSAICPVRAVAGSILEKAPFGLSAWCVDPCGASPVLPDADDSSALSGGLDAVAAGGSVATLSLVVKSDKPVAAFSVVQPATASAAAPDAILMNSFLFIFVPLPLTKN